MGRPRAAASPTASPRRSARRGRGRAPLPRPLARGRGPEGDEGARRDESADFAGEELLAVALAQRAFEHEAAPDVVGRALDHHRLALALGGPGSELGQLARARLPLAGRRGRQQRAVADEVRVAPDGRGEVAVAAGVQPRVAEVLRRVVGLLERAQQQRAEGRGAVAGARDVALDRREISPISSAACEEDMGSGIGGVGTSSEASWSTRRSIRSGSGRSWTR